MDWSLRKVFPFTMGPQGCSASEVFDDTPRPIKRTVAWKSASRVGVVMRDKNEGWRIAWFEGGHAERHGQLPLLTGGNWRGDLAAADEIEFPSADRVTELRLASPETDD